MNILAIKIHIYIYTFIDENQGNAFLINECNKPTEDGATTFHPTIEWLSQYLFSHSPPCHIPSMNVGSHRTHQSKLIQGFQRPSTSTHQIVIPTSQLEITKPSSDWSPSKPSRAFRAFVQPRLPEIVTQTTTYIGLPERLSKQGF